MMLRQSESKISDFAFKNLLRIYKVESDSIYIDHLEKNGIIERKDNMIYIRNSADDLKKYVLGIFSPYLKKDGIDVLKKSLYEKRPGNLEDAAKIDFRSYAILREYGIIKIGKKKEVIIGHFSTKNKLLNLLKEIKIDRDGAVNKIKYDKFNEEYRLVKRKR